MKVHIAWSALEAASADRRSAALYALLSPDRKEVVFIGARALSSLTLPPAASISDLAFQEYLNERYMLASDLYPLVGEVHLPGGEELSDTLIQSVVTLLRLGEEPQGNEALEESPEVPAESFAIHCYGRAWPGYGKLSIEPDGDLLVEHVLMGSVIPPAPST
jgi:hypothetical protein